jgi:hypothetical protein
LSANDGYARLSLGDAFKGWPSSRQFGLPEERQDRVTPALALLGEGRDTKRKAGT